MDKEIRKEVISILVDNQANVLTRVSSLFGRRGFNIDSLTVSATNYLEAFQDNGSIYRDRAGTSPDNNSDG